MCQWKKFLPKKSTIQVDSTWLMGLKHDLKDFLWLKSLNWNWAPSKSSLRVFLMVIYNQKVM